MILLNTMPVVETILSSIVVFLLVIFTLVGLLLFVKAKLAPSGKITIKINGEKELIVDGGDTLLSTLSFFHLLVVAGEHVCSVLVKLIVEEEAYCQQRNHIFLGKRSLITGV